MFQGCRGLEVRGLVVVGLRSLVVWDRLSKFQGAGIWGWAGGLQGFLVGGFALLAWG